MEESIIMGIDLGTYFSEMARVAPSGGVEMIPNLEGELKTASIVSWAAKGPVAGKAARPDLVFAPRFVIQCGKRSMGKRTEQGKPIPVSMGPDGHEITVVDSAAALLKYLKQCAEAYLGHLIERAVITVPAYFDTAARDDTRAAAKIAGFEEVRLVNEPEAAAIYYGLEKARNEIVVVVDSGGGTTDVTAIEITGNGIHTLATDGDWELGGANWDEGILEWMCKNGKAKGIVISAEKDLATFYANLDRAREAKEMLSRRDDVPVIVEGDGKRIKAQLSRRILRQVTKELDKRLVACCTRLLDALKAKGKKPGRVILVGGNCRQPHIAELVQGVFGLEPARDADLDLIVAQGAAIYAEICFGDKSSEIVIGGHRYLAQDIQVQTVAAHPLCVAARRSKDDPTEYNCVIVPAGTSLPHEFQERFSPANPGQQEVTVKIVQGPPDAPSADATVLRDIRVPIQPSDKDTDRIDIKGRYTAEGLLELTVVDDLLGNVVSDSFIHPSGLSGAEIEQKRRDMAAPAEGKQP